MKKIALFIYISIFFILGFAIQHSLAVSPVILGSPAPQALYIIGPGAQITWTTDIPSDSQVYYGTSNTPTSFPYYSSSRCDSGGNITSHCINLTGLSASTIYYFKVKSCNADGCTEGSGYQFTSGSGSGGTTSTSCPSNIASLLGSGCHDMGNAYFNGEMTQYVNYGGSTLYYCSTNYIAGCTTGGGGSTIPGSPYLTLPSTSASPVYLSWTTVSGATSYEVWRRTPPSTGTFASVTTGLTGLSYNDSGVTSGISYEYYIKACNSYGCSSSNYATVSVSVGGSGTGSPPPAPGWPAGLSSIRTNTTYSYLSSLYPDPDGDQVKIIFDWGDGTFFESAYYTVTTSGSGRQDVIASHAWTSGGSYTIKTKARDTTGKESGWSTSAYANVANNTNNPPFTPAAPTGNQNVNTQTSYQYSTYLYPDNDGDQVQAVFDWGDGSTFTSTSFITPQAGGTEVSASHTFTVVGNYYIYVHAHDNFGVGLDSTISSPLSVSAAAAPSAPSGLSASAVSSSQINLSWTASANNAGYKIYRNGTFLSNTTLSYYNDTGLSANTSYSYTVAGYNTLSAISSQSSPVSATTQSGSTSAPTPPTSVTAASETGRVFVSWPSSGSAKYSIWRSTSGGAYQIWYTNITNAYYGDLSVSQSTIYRYKVYGCNSDGTTCSSSGTESNSITYSGGNVSCTGIILTLNDGKTTYTIGSDPYVNYTWTCSPGGSVSGYTYMVLQKPDNTSLLLNSSGGSTQTFGISTLNTYMVPGSYILKACSDSNCGATMRANQTFTLVSPSSSASIPSIPTITVPYTSGISVNVSWSSVSNATEYKLFRRLPPNGSWSQITTGFTGTSYSDSGVVSGYGYEYHVNACNSVGCSADSNTAGVSVNVGTLSPCPSNVASLLGSGCHDMGNAYFNGEMTQYVNYGGSTIYYCSTNYISSCTSGGGSGTIPTTPSSLRQTSSTASSITLAWYDNSLSEDKFNLERTLSGGSSSWALVSQLGANIINYTDSSVTGSINYDYRIQACLSGYGCSGYTYLYGVSTLSSTAATTTTSTSCPSNIASLLGTGCHDMGNAYFNGGMTQYVYYGGSTVYNCTTSYISGCSTGTNTATTTTTTSCPGAISSLLGSGCHDMGNAYFNGEMTRYVYYSGTTIYYCSTNYISGCSSGPTTGDVTLPGVISNLSANNSTQNSVTLFWTATGDDGTIGTAYSYSVKYSLSPITSETAWQTANYSSGIPAPYPAGTNQTMVVSGLSANTTYYFAIKAYDDAGNVSPLSNSSTAKTLSASATSTVIDTISPYVTTFGYTTESDGRLRAGALFSEPIDESTLTDFNIYIMLSRDGSKVSGTITKHTVEKGVDYFTTNPAEAGADYQLVVKKNIKDPAGNQMAQDYFSPKFQRNSETTVTPSPTEITPTETPKLLNWGLGVGLDGYSTIGVSFNVEMDYATFNESNAYLYKISDPSYHLPVIIQKKPYYAMLVAKLTPGTEYVSVIKSSVKSLASKNLLADYACKFSALSSGYITSCPEGALTTDLSIISPEVKKYGILEAQVLDSEEKPLANAGVHIFKEDFSANFGGTTDSQGFFKNTIPSGTYLIEIFPPSGKTDLIKPQPIKFEILSEETKKLTIRFGVLSKTITGTVLFSNDASITDAEVGAYSSTNNQWVSTFTNSDGRYTIKVGSGKWIVGIRPKDPQIAKWTWSGQMQEAFFTVNPGPESVFINFRIPLLTSKLIIKAVDDLGNPVFGAGVIVSTISSAQSYSDSRIAPEFRKSDIDGKAEFSLAPALYYIRGVIDTDRGYLNPEEQPVQITKDEIREIRLVFKRKSVVETVELSGLAKLENGSPLDAYIWSWSEEGKFAETHADENGKFKVQLVKTEKWHIGAGKVLNGISYKADDIIVNLQNTGITLEIVLFKHQELPPPITVTQSATQQIVVQAEDGAKTVIPSGAISGSAAINVELKPTTEVPSQAGAQIIGTAYDVNITDTAGKAVTQFAKDVEINLPYNEVELKAEGINEDRLIPSFFDASTTAWIKVDNYTLDKEKDVIIIRVSHLTRFAIVAAADITPPDAPANVKISELTGGKVKIAWINPAKDFHHVKIYHSEVNGELGAIALNDISGTSAEDSGLASGKTYYYLLRSIDPAGNESNNTIQTKITMAGTLAKTEISAMGGKEEPKKLPLGIAVKLEILRNLTSGAQGEDVKAIQELLLKEGVYPDGLITGFFGNLTKQAVIRFQEKYADEILKPAGLVNGTGFVGPSTIKKINKLLRVNGAVSLPPGQAQKFEISRMFFEGDSGDDVKAIQELLLKEGVYPEGLITGFFGNLTKQAVIRFQEKYADEILKPVGYMKGTGIVGSRTMAKINQLLSPVPPRER